MPKNPFYVLMIVSLVIASFSAAKAADKVVVIPLSGERQAVRPTAVTYTAFAISGDDVNTDMIDVSAGECFLHRVHTESVNVGVTNTSIFNLCEIYDNGSGKWVLRAFSAAYESTFCHARCLTW